jgi:hypothetical protein
MSVCISCRLLVSVFSKVSQFNPDSDFNSNLAMVIPVPQCVQSPALSPIPQSIDGEEEELLEEPNSTPSPDELITSSSSSTSWCALFNDLNRRCCCCHLRISLLFRWFVFTSLLIGSVVAFSWQTIASYLLAASLIACAALIGLSNCFTEYQTLEGTVNPRSEAYGRNVRFIPLPPRIMTVGGSSTSSSESSHLVSV